MDKILRATPVNGVRRLSYPISDGASAKRAAGVAGHAASPQKLDRDSSSMQREQPLPETVEALQQELRLLRTAIAACQTERDELASERSQLKQQLDIALDQEELSRVRQQGYDDGHSEGMAKAQSEVREQIDAALQSFQQLLEGIEQKGEACWQQIETQVSDLSFAVVCKLLGEAATDPSVVGALVAEVLKSARESLSLRIHLSPKDFLILNTASERERLGRGRRVELVEDLRVELGGCLVETDFGTWDGRLENQMRLLKNAVDQAFKDFVDARQ